MRARDHRALPYAHFYARNGTYLKRITHLHILNLGENPFATLRLATTLIVLSALGITVAALALAGPRGNYSVSGGVIAVIVSAPGVLAAWSRQTFGVEALNRACLTTQFSLRATTALSLLALSLAVLQSSGVARWTVNLGILGNVELPVSDGWWLALCAFSWLLATFVAFRYITHRSKYLCIKRRALAPTYDRDWFG
jgi:hypothetical protein